MLLNTRSRPFASLQRQNPAPRIANRGNQFVKLGVIARPDQPPIIFPLIFLACTRQGTIDQLTYLWTGIKLIGQFY